MASLPTSMVRGESRRLRTAEQRFDARQQFARLKAWSRNHRPPSPGQRRDRFIAAAGQHEDRETIERVIPANFPANIQAGNFRKHEVEKQEIRRAFSSGY